MLRKRKKTLAPAEERTCVGTQSLLLAREDGGAFGSNIVFFSIEIVSDGGSRGRMKFIGR